MEFKSLEERCVHCKGVGNNVPVCSLYKPMDSKRNGYRESVKPCGYLGFSVIAWELDKQKRGVGVSYFMCLKEQ